jgi:hypothetical protein
MPYPYPADLGVIANACFDKVQANEANLGIAVTYYGDQDMLPVTPAVCIEPSDKVRTLAGAPNMTENVFEVFILVYHSKVQDMQVTRREVDALAYQIEKLFHLDLQLKNGGPDPRVIHGFIREVESGYALKGTTLYRAARLTYFGKNKTSLPEN